MSRADPALAAAANELFTLKDIELVILDLAACLTIRATRGEVMSALREALARQPGEPRIVLMDRILARRAACAAVIKAKSAAN